MAETLTAASLTWGLTPGETWPAADDVLAAAVALLPELDDDVTADVIEALALAVVDGRERITATRTNLAIALAAMRTHEREITRLRARLAELLDARRKVAA